jgi:OFA family oxalate/formate antiporter-like MFS transporter
MTFFAIQGVAFFFPGRLDHPLALQIVLCLIITCYGGGFASMPAFLSDIFGAKNVSAILGLILTAWSAAGIAGPVFIAWVRQTTGSYERTFLVFSGMLFVGLMLAILLTREVQKNRSRNFFNSDSR